MKNQYDALRLLKLAEKLGIEESDLDDYVHELKSEEAKEINNNGLRAQIHYLVRSNGAKWTKDTIKAIGQGIKEVGEKGASICDISSKDSGHGFKEALSAK